jgi:hypothetical protein
LMSVSYGVGQVMGENWKLLGYDSVESLVEEARSGLVGQVTLMIKFIEKAGLAGKLRTGDFKGFARGYNGPSYALNRYDTKMASAAAEWRKLLKGVHEIPSFQPETSFSGSVLQIQRRLVLHGFKVAIDGERGPQTEKAIMDFQKSKKLRVDGVVGNQTWKALEEEPAKAAVVNDAPVKVETVSPPMVVEKPARKTFTQAIIEMFAALLRRK